MRLIRSKEEPVRWSIYRQDEKVAGIAVIEVRAALARVDKVMLLNSVGESATTTDDQPRRKCTDNGEETS
jgi:hypothetical protein